MNRRVPATALLVERRDNVRAAYSEALRLAGLKVTEARDAAQALDAVTTIHPTIIVAEFDSQTRDECLSLCRAMKADPHTTRIPIVLTTPDLSGDDVALATDPGVLVLTLMPSDGAKLAAAINGVLAAQRAEPLRADEEMRGVRRKRGDECRHKSCVAGA
jgi:CheY-like chemotaxis protein